VLPEEIEVCAIQLPGREQRIGEEPFTSTVQAAEALALALPPYFDEPFAFFGHSMGAGIAYETALAVRRRQGLTPACLMASGRRAPHLPARKPPVHRLPDHLLIEELRRLNGTPPEVLEDQELMELMLPVLRGDFRLAEDYQASSTVLLQCPVTAFGGDRDPDVPIADLVAWETVCGGMFRLHVLPGDHFFINHQAPKVLELVRAELSRFLL
jgi:medium-chain acyl-[acyl-carrier-protein] hydrolase